MVRIRGKVSRANSVVCCTTWLAVLFQQGCRLGGGPPRTVPTLAGEPQVPACSDEGACHAEARPGAPRASAPRNGGRVMLTDKQLAAIDLLVAGHKGVDIEKQIGVSHVTLFRWKHEDEFLSVWEAERARAHEERVEKLWRVGERAMDVVLESLEEGDPTMARDVGPEARRPGPGRRPPGPADGSPGAAASPPIARILTDDQPARHKCVSCGKVCKSAGALASHRRILPCLESKVGSLTNGGDSPRVTRRQ